MQDGGTKNTFGALKGTRNNKWEERRGHPALFSGDLCNDAYKVTPK